MLARHLSKSVMSAAAENPVVTLTGPRQSGKTTLCQTLFPDHEYLSLEAPDVRSRAIEDPRGFLASENDLVIDEIQRAPDLLSYVQVLVDENPRPGRFVLTGSQNLLLIKSVSQTLAGRTALLRLYPFSLSELLERDLFDPARLSESTAAVPDVDRWECLFQGFYPRIHDRNLSPREWLGDYFRTYVERDLSEILAVSDLRAFENFVRLAAASTAMGTEPEQAGGRCRGRPADCSPVAKRPGNRVSGRDVAAALRQLPQAAAQAATPSLPGTRDSSAICSTSRMRTRWRDTRCAERSSSRSSCPNSSRVLPVAVARRRSISGAMRLATRSMR